VHTISCFRVCAPVRKPVCNAPCQFSGFTAKPSPKKGQKHPKNGCVTECNAAHTNSGIFWVFPDFGTPFLSRSGRATRFDTNLCFRELHTPVSRVCTASKVELCYTQIQAGILRKHREKQGVHSGNAPKSPNTKNHDFWTPFGSRRQRATRFCTNFGFLGPG
jgi:hypothetical protein